VLARDTSADTPPFMGAPLAPPATARTSHAGDHFATHERQQQPLYQQPPLQVALCLAQPTTRGKHQRVLARDPSADAPLFMGAPRAPPATAHTALTGDHFATRE
jgi:hypothetical protein